MITNARQTANGIIRGINWNKVEDPLDSEVWNKLTSNFWLPEAIPLSLDLSSWNNMTPDEKWSTARVFAGLTLLDTMQGRFGATSLLDDAQTQHEEAVLSNIVFMEAVHAKSYSSIFSTLLSSEEIEDAFRWSDENEELQEKSKIILDIYQGDDPAKRKIASVILESFMFYSGFYAPMYWSSKGKLTNTADLIKLIIRDEAIHGYYVGAKYQRQIHEESDSRKKELEKYSFDLLEEIFAIEKKFSADLYDDIGRTEDVHKFLKYNANKTLMNLGYEPLYSRAETDVNAAVLSAISDTSGSNHDFFSGAGDSYVIGKTEDASDEWGDLFDSM